MDTIALGHSGTPYAMLPRMDWQDLETTSRRIAEAVGTRYYDGGGVRLGRRLALWDEEQECWRGHVVGRAGAQVLLETEEEVIEWLKA